MGNFFLEKPYPKCGAETSSRLLFTNKIWADLWINSLKSFTVYFYCMSKLRTTKTFWNYGSGHLLLHHIKPFWKRGLKLVSLIYFLHNFWRKIFFTLHSIIWSNFIVWLSLLFEILWNMCFVTICFPIYDP